MTKKKLALRRKILFLGLPEAWREKFVYPVIKPAAKYDFAVRMALAPGVYEYQHANPSTGLKSIVTRTYKRVYKEFPDLDPVKRKLEGVPLKDYVAVSSGQGAYYAVS